jgi:5-methylcytosine-specific restriction protein B
MNTADRSVEALDAALRRRFHFTEMPPVAQIIRDKGVDEIGEFNTADILETINNRIKILLDRDHLIGHSYFLKIKNMEDLRRVFVDRIIPLLQEYFYGDYSKIALVLGKGFCDIDEQLNKYDFAPDLDEFSENYDERKVFTLQKIESTEDFIAALKKMVKPKKETDEEQ